MLRIDIQCVMKNKLWIFNILNIFAPKLSYLRLFCILLFLTFSTYSFTQTYVGTATIYSQKFNGKKTFSGQVFRSNKVSAAHPWFTMGTKIQVTNLKNNKKVILTINDRMGKSSGYLLDMSTAAAKKIGLESRHGITRIKVKILN